MRALYRDSQMWIAGFVFVVRVGLACMFLLSALPKIRQPYDFLSSVYSYELVGSKVGLLAAMTLPWLELLTGICLLGAIFVGGAFLASAGMAAVFTFVVGWALYQGLNISCGCFGSGTETITYVTLIRAIGIMLISLLAYAAVMMSSYRAAVSEDCETATCQRGMLNGKAPTASRMVDPAV